jgi:hypothetical protein
VGARLCAVKTGVRGGIFGVGALCSVYSHIVADPRRVIKNTHGGSPKQAFRHQAEW